MESKLRSVTHRDRIMRLVLLKSIDISEREAERLSDFCLTLDFERSLDCKLDNLRAKIGSAFTALD